MGDRIPYSSVAKVVGVAALSTPADRLPRHASEVGPSALPLVIIILVGLTYLAKRTAFGRHVYAVGGNAEAARRGGINVSRVRISSS